MSTVSPVAKAILARMLARQPAAPVAIPAPPVRPVRIQRAAMRPRGRPEYAYEMRHYGASPRLRYQVLYDGVQMPIYKYTKIRGRRGAQKPRYKTEHAHRRI